MYGTSNINKQENEIQKLAIDLGQNNIKYINIYNDTNPEELAYNFCYVNHLDYHSLIQLREKIKKVLIDSKKNINIRESNEIKSLLSNDYDDLSKPIYNKFNNKNEKIQREIFENLNNNNSYLKNKKSNINSKNLYKNLKNDKITKKSNSIDKTNHSYRAPTVNSSTRKKLTNNLSMNESNDNKIDIISNDYLKRSNTNISNRNNSKINSNSNSRIKSSYQIQSLLNDNKENKNLNYGERLYHKCEKLGEKINNKIQKIKNEKEKKLKNECTFKPKINKMSHYISYRNNNRSNYDDEDNILYYREYIDRKLSYLKERYAQKDENCYFSPKINKTKKKDNNLIPRYEQLYQKSKQLKTKREFLSNSIYNKDKFKPSINKVYNTEMTNLPFDERQNAFNSKTTEKKKQMKSQIENNIDSITGQKFFKPIINESNNSIKRNSNDIFENLFSDYKKQIIKKQQAEKEMEEKFSPLETFANEQSNEIFYKQKLNCFEKIFYILDKDQDGIITKFNIYVNGLPKNIQEILSPIIIELKQDNETLNKDEFSAACFKLYDTLSFLKKREIINYGMNKKNNKNNDEYIFTFKPKIQNNYNPNIYYEKQKKEQEEEINIEKKNTNKTNSNNQENNEENLIPKLK